MSFHLPHLWEARLKIVVQSPSHVQLSDHMNCSTPALPVLHYLLQFVQTHVHSVSDAIQQSHSLLYPSPLVHSLSQHQGLSH